MERQQGFTYLGVLLAIALLGLGMTAASEVWFTTARRQRLEQLEWVGQQFVQAIGSYQAAAPAGYVNAYPPTLSDLLDDRRFPFVRRHLRQLYANPLSGKPDWEVVLAPDGGVRGVRVRIPNPIDDKPETREFAYVPATH